MKTKMMLVVMMATLAAGIAQAAIQNNVYTGNADDGDFNNAANWWNSITTNDALFFRGDNIAANPGRANTDLSAPATVSQIIYQGSVDPNAAYNITGSGGTLTVDGVPEAKTTLINVYNAVAVDQTIAADLVLKTVNNANNQHILTGSGGGLVLSGTVSQDAGSAGLGIFVGNGDVELAGDVNGAGKLWKVRDNSGTGVLKLTGSGVWSGFGTVQIDNGAEVLLNRTTTDSTGFGPGVLQVLDGGTLSLGNDEQIFNSVDVALGSGTFNLEGNTETVNSLKFLAADDSASLDMGAGGTLNLDNQDSAAIWGDLTVYNWSLGSEHIYVNGGSFSSDQLAAITFDGSGVTGAQVVGGELVAIPEPAVIGLMVIFSGGMLAARRLMV